MRARVKCGVPGGVVVSQLSTLLSEIRDTLVETGAFSDWEFDLMNTGLGQIHRKFDVAIDVAEHYEVRVDPSPAAPASRLLQ